MADGGFDVLIRFITELVGENAVKSTTDSLEDLRKKVDDSDKSLKTQSDLLKKWKSELVDLKDEYKRLYKEYKKFKDYSEGSKKVIASQDPEYAKFLELEKAINLANVGIKYQKQVVDQAKESHKNLTQQLRDEEQVQSEIIQNLRTMSDIESRRAGQARRTADRLQSFGNATTIAGVAIGGGIIAEATRYAQKMGDATRGTAEFNAELKKIERARGRIDAVLVAEVTPILAMASKVANIVAGIVEDNPQLISLALKSAALLVSVGTLAKIASSGIRMYADLTFEAAQALGLRAAEMQLLASNNQLAAAGMKGGVVAAASAAGGITTGTVGVIATGGVVLGTGLSVGIDLLKNKLLELSGASETTSKIVDTFVRSITGVIPLVKIGDDVQNLARMFGIDLTKMAESTLKAVSAAKEAAPALDKFGENTEKLLDIFSKMREDLAEEESRYQASRMKIISSSNAAMERAASSSASKIRSINERAAASRVSIISNFVKSSAEDVRRYEAERARIIRDGGLEIARIEQERLEKQRQLEMDHNDRVDELVANRDALGLVLEQRKFDRERAEIDRNANKEIAQRRQDLAIRLQDLAQNFAAERAQKQAQFQQDLKENEAKRQEEIKAERTHLIEQTREIQKNRVNQLRELALQHAEEMRRIRESTIAKIRDLDASLLGEQQKKRQYQALMLQDLDRFLAEYRRRMAGGFGSGTVRGRATGGYVNNELIQTHGVEFVTSASTTRALERLIGGRLNQQNLVAAVAGVGNNVTWNDQRRFDGTYNKNMKRQVESDTIDTIRKAFEK